jgi:putative PIN family toxin of toxin-antitoxin system
LRVVLDATVYVSAAITQGASNRIVMAFARDAAFEAIVSWKLLDEIYRVLTRKNRRFQFSPGVAGGFITVLYHEGQLEPDVPNPPAITRDPDDDYLVALAISAHAEAIVSDNVHLLELKIVRDGRREIPVLTSSQFHAFLERSGLFG